MAYAPKQAHPSIHGKRLYLTRRGRLVQGDMDGVVSPIVTSLTAAGTAVTAVSAETALVSHSIPAGNLRAGSLIRFGWQGICTATNGTDTVAVTAYVNSTAVATGTATDVANNAIFAGDGRVAVRTIGSAGTFIANALHTKVPAASLTATRVQEITASTTIDTTAAAVISVKATWSSNSSANSCRMDDFWVEYN